MVNKKSNPAFVKGKSGNPKGRPKGTNSLTCYRQNPDTFFLHHIRWERFCWNLIYPALGNRAKAARLSGYSPKSARFIGSRLLKKDVIRVRITEIQGLIKDCEKKKVR